jgi:hypothetical protein
VVIRPTFGDRDASSGRFSQHIGKRARLSFFCCWLGVRNAKEERNSAQLDVGRLNRLPIA